MTIGLTPPFITEPDPDRAGEGSLDPLGLFRIADPLADLLAAEVTARMSRIRFLTAIAVCSHIVEDPVALTAADGTPAYLAFEWHVVEAFVRSPPATGTVAVPGILKARARVRHTKRHLDAGSYLQTPKVFGFHGVYKRLAKDLRIVDDDLVLLPRGDELLHSWEREQRLDGFTLKRARTRGGKLAGRLAAEVRRALDQGSVVLGPTSAVWGEVSRTLAPGDVGGSERRRLWDWLTDERHPERRELALLVGAHPDVDAGERETVENLLGRSISPELRIRLEAVTAFEAAVRPLDDAFRLLRSLASQRTPSPVSAAEAAVHPQLQVAAAELPDAVRAASESLGQVGLGADIDMVLGSFAEELQPDQLVETLLDRHDQVQAAKDKRSWFERDERGFAVRGIGRLDGALEPLVDYLHPYRIHALRSFARDLQPQVAV